MNYYEDEYRDWDKDARPCRAVRAEDKDGKVEITDGPDTKPPCSSFDEAYGDKDGAVMYLDPEDRTPAKKLWPALKRAMEKDVRQDIGIVDDKIRELMDEVAALRAERAGLSKTLARVRLLKL